MAWKWGLQSNLWASHPYRLTQPLVTPVVQPNLPATPSIYLIGSQYSGTGAWLDNSPNARNATIENGTATKSSDGRAIVLDGATNWAFTDINVGNAWTCEVWYKNTGSIVGTNPCILTQIYIGNHINICLGYGANVGFSYHQGGVGWRQGTSISITNSAWTHYVGTWNGTTITTYLNGIQQGTTTPGMNSILFRCQLSYWKTMGQS